MVIPTPHTALYGGGGNKHDILVYHLSSMVHGIWILLEEMVWWYMNLWSFGIPWKFSFTINTKHGSWKAIVGVNLLSDTEDSQIVMGYIITCPLQWQFTLHGWGLGWPPPTENSHNPTILRRKLPTAQRPIWQSYPPVLLFPLQNRPSSNVLSHQDREGALQDIPIHPPAQINI